MDIYHNDILAYIYSETWITRTAGDHQTKFELWKVRVKSFALLLL